MAKQVNAVKVKVEQGIILDVDSNCEEIFRISPAPVEGTDLNWTQMRVQGSGV